MYTLKERLEGEYGIVRIPQYIANRCNDRKSQGGDCTICAEICPEHIYPAGKRKHLVWDRCVKCGLCARLCPMAAIDPNDVSSVVGKCIKCCACVKKCPKGAKYFDHEGYLYHQHELEELYARRADSEIFIEM